MTGGGPAARGTEITPWDLDHVLLTTVGVDIGSATSHLAFSRVLLERDANAYSSRFVVAGTEVLYRSEVLLTPYLGDPAAGGQSIDVSALEEFVSAGYRQAGLTAQDIDAGAVILTGVALERVNARAIAELFAESGGRFVCASAGHHLEALLAAHGSGAVAASRRDRTVVLNIDVGGGTTKLSLAQDGRVLATMAVDGGGRIVSWGADGAVERVERSARALAGQLGIELRARQVLAAGDRRMLSAGVVRRILAAARALPCDGVLMGRIPPQPRPARIVLSGGVVHYLAPAHGSAGQRAVADLGETLAEELPAALATLGVPVSVADDPLRATVLGASQYGVQLSGSTIWLSEVTRLPHHNLPVVVFDAGPALAEANAATDVAEAEQVEAAVRQLRETALRDLAGDLTQAFAIAVRWRLEPRYPVLRRLAATLATFHRERHAPGVGMFVCLDADLAASLGTLLSEEFDCPDELVIVDGVELRDMDFVDFGQPIEPGRILPVVVKSLLFPAGSGQATRPVTAGMR